MEELSIQLSSNAGWQLDVWTEAVKKGNLGAMVICTL